MNIWSSWMYTNIMYSYLLVWYTYTHPSWKYTYFENFQLNENI